MKKKLTLITLLYFLSNTILADIQLLPDSKKVHKNAEKAMSQGNFAIAYCLWEPIAKTGDPKAQFNIGWMYHNGYGLAISDTTALAWWLKSAEQGYVDSFYTLADLYLAGFGVDKDLDIAMGWYIAAAEYGHEASLEIIHELPNRTDKLGKKYFNMLIEDHWFLRSAKRGDKQSLSILLALAHNKDKKKQQYLSQILKENWALFGNKMQVKVARANVRRGPGKQFKIVKSLSKGQPLIKLSSKGNWVQIAIEGSGKIAWVFKSLIKPIEQIKSMGTSSIEPSL